ncbi:MAG: Ig-like domain-containing protein [Myxococcota bacterium]
MSATLSTLTVDRTTCEADGACTITVAVTVRDTTSSPVEGAQVAIFATDANVLGVVPDTDAQGRSVVGISATVAGNKVISAVVNPGVSQVTLQQTASVTFTPGPPVALVFITQPNSAVAGTALSAVSITTLDARGNVATTPTQITVALQNNPTGATLLGTLQRTTSNGSASFNDLNIQRAGTGYTLVAQVQGLNPVVSGGFNITPATPTTLAFGVQPGRTTATFPINPAVTVLVQDNFGNTVPTHAGNVAVDLQGGNANATLGGTTTQPFVSGVATFADLTVDLQATGYTLLATSGGLQDATSNVFAITAEGQATRLVFVTQPGNVVAGANLGTLNVEAQDDVGNLDTTFSTDVRLDFGNNPGNGALFGTVTATASQGVAQFSGVSIRKAAAGYTLRAIDDADPVNGLNAGVSNAFTISAGNVDRLGFLVEPSNTVAGQFMATLEVAAQDQYLNTNPTYAGNVTLDLTSNPLNATLEGATEPFVLGVATFDVFTINRPGNYTLIADDGTFSVTSAAFTIQLGPPDHVVKVGVDQDGVAGLALAQPLQVTVVDAEDNPVPGASVRFTILQGSGDLREVGGPDPGVQQTQLLVTSDGNGLAQATFFLDPVVGVNRVRADLAAGTLVPVEFVSNGGPGAPAILEQTGDGQTGVVATALQPFVVTVKDANNNVVPNTTVTFELGLGAGSLTQTSVQTNAQGQAQTVLTLGQTAGTSNNTVVARVNLLSYTFTASAIPDVAAEVLIESGDNQSATVGQQLTQSLVVRVEDRFNNRVPDVTVDFSVLTGGGSLSANIDVTDANGLASTDLTVGTVAGVGNNTVQALVTGLTPVTFSASATAGNADHIEIANGDAQTGTVGAALPQALQVRVEDVNGNPVQGVQVDFAVTAGGGSLSVAFDVSDASGIAETVWTLGTVAGATNTVQATSGAFPALTFSATANPGNATQLVFTTQPPTGTFVGTQFNVAVQARDAFNNVPTNLNGQTITLTVGNNPGGATLNATQTMSNGSAAFNAVQLDKGGVAVTLRASAPPALLAGSFDSDAFDVQAGVIVVTELMWTTAAESGKFIEIWNNSLSAVELQGYRFATGTTAADEAVVTGTFSLTANNRVRVGIAGSGAEVIYTPGASFAPTPGANLKMISGSGELQDAVNTANFVTSGTPGADVFPFFTNVSTQLGAGFGNVATNDDGDNWCITFGAAHTGAIVNQNCTADLATLLISEVLYEAAADGQAFVELLGGGGISLQGVELRAFNAFGTQDNAVVMTPLGAGVRMPVDGYLVVGDLSGGTTQVANADVTAEVDPTNDTDGSMRLLVSGNTKDTLGWGAPTLYEGTAAADVAQSHSLARPAGTSDTNNNANDFLDDGSPTPGASNGNDQVDIDTITPDRSVADATAPTIDDVVITGRGFQGTTTVTFGGQAATCTVDSATQLTCDAVPGATAAARVAVVVTNDQGSTQTRTNAFTYVGSVNETGLGEELDLCSLNNAALTTTAGTPVDVLGQVTETGQTDNSNVAVAGITSEVGVGPSGTDPRTNTLWRFTAAAPNATYDFTQSADEHILSYTPAAAGTYSYVIRFSLNRLDYTYCDSDGAGSNGGADFSTANLGTLTVN